MQLSTGSALASSFVIALSLTLAACAGPAEEQNPSETTAAATEAVASEAASAVPSDAASDAASAAPSEAASAAPSAAPSAAASTAARPAPAAPAVVAEPAAFAVCKACHSVAPGQNGIGPSLAGIWGEKAGAVPGFTFSDAMIASGLTWNQGTLDRYLTDPRGVVPGTKMAFGGVKDAAKRAEIIAYIRGL